MEKILPYETLTCRLCNGEPIVPWDSIGSGPTHHTCYPGEERQTLEKEGKKFREFLEEAPPSDIEKDNHNDLIVLMSPIEFAAFILFQFHINNEDLEKDLHDWYLLEEESKNNTIDRIRWIKRNLNIKIQTPDESKNSE